jgi:hypothetical protein
MSIAEWSRQIAEVAARTAADRPATPMALAPLA